MAASFEEKLDRLADQLARSSEEFDRRLKASEEWLKKSREEFDQRLKAFDQRLKAFDQRLEASEEWLRRSREEFDRRLMEHQRRMDEADKQRAEADKQRAESAKQWAEHQRWMKQADKRWGDIANVQGEIAEDLFRRNAVTALRSHGIQVDDVYTNLKVPGVREYDIVLVNGREAVVLEIKNKLRGDDITKFLHTQLPQFKTAFPQYERYQVYGGIGALVMAHEQEAAVSEAGLFVLTQGEDGAAHLQKPETLHVW